MSVSREQRARGILTIGELAARNLTLDVHDVEDPRVVEVNDAYEKFVSKAKYLRARASAAWLPAFEGVLDSSHSMRVELIPVGRNKDSLRPRFGTCMACGRREQNCRYSIDLAGEFDPDAWLQSVENVRKAYDGFSKEYEACFAPAAVSQACHQKELPRFDNGSFVVGETCLRKAKLRYQLQTTILEVCYEADRQLEHLVEKHGLESIHRDKMYTLSDEQASKFVERMDAIELAIADEKRFVPEMPLDASFWEVVDTIRGSVSGDDDDVFNAMIKSRATMRLGEQKSKKGNQENREGHRQYQGSECSDVDESEDFGNEKAKETAFVRRSGRLASRKRACVVTDESDDEDETEHNKQGKRAKQLPLDEDDEEEEEEEVHVTHTSSSGPSSRSPNASVSEMVSSKRADGLLPSRKKALLSLMELQIKLQRDERHADAAVCTNAIQTLQELLDRVERLAHSPHL